MSDAIDVAAMALGAIGQPVRRKEDQRLLTGKGRFTDDFNMPGQAYAVMVRSPTRMRGSSKLTWIGRGICRVSSACSAARIA
jgi:hypothetical protein